MATTLSSPPPPPRLLLRIGVTGHRPNRLAAEREDYLKDQCRQIITNLRDAIAGVHDPDLYSPDPPLLRVVSSLAEGADRIVAEAGLALGADLQCPLPFAAEEYEADFESGASRTRFRSLLARASAVLQQNGKRDAADAAYESAGRTVIYQSDLLIAIWDGKAAAGRGGTAQMVGEAVAQRVPVIWMHALEQTSPCLLIRSASGEMEKVAIDRLPEALKLHFGFADEGKKLARGFYRERRPRFNPGHIFRLFHGLMVPGKMPWSGRRFKDCVASMRQQWDDSLASYSGFPAGVRTYILEKACPHFAWADGLSNYYAGCFRSSSLAVNLLGGFSVAFALVGFLLENPVPKRLERIPVLAEFLSILAILAITLYGRRRQWHEKWLNYRQLAERFRQAAFLGPLGCTAPSPHLPAHLGDDPHNPWITGIARAVERDIGLVHARVDPPYLLAVSNWLGAFVQDQIDYHERNSGAAEKLHRRLHKISTMLFIGTLVVCTTHLVMTERHWMLFTAAVFPALGASLYSISNQGEWARLAKRSHAMKRELIVLKETELQNALGPGGENMESLRVAAEHLAGIMIGETADWIFLFRLRSLILPG